MNMAAIADLTGPVALPVHERMRVLLVHERFAPDFGGGGERVVLAIAKYLIHAGVDVTVLTAGDPSVQEYEGVPTLRLPISRHRMNFAVPSVVRLARQADLIHTFNYHACLPSLIAGRLARKPVVCTFLGVIGDTWIQMRGPFLGRAYRSWESLLLKRHFARTIFLTEDNQKKSTALGGNDSRVVINPPGIELADFAPAAPKQNLVLFVGKFDVRKGVYDVLQVARNLPEVPFVMIGWGALESELRRSAPPNVSFYAIADRIGLRRWLARASIFFLPSTGEGFPIALLEAMASGCAVVSSVPVPFEGTRVNSGHAADMTRAIRDLWSSPENTVRLGMLNAERAQQFSWDTHVSRLIEIYRQVLAENEGGASH